MDEIREKLMDVTLHYTPEVLAVVCPECCAAVTGKCLDKLPLGGSRYREKPHLSRFVLAHPTPEQSK